MACQSDSLSSRPDKMHSHDDEHGPISHSPKQSPAAHSRPPYSHPPSRQSSLSRRQTSLSSPRELPLPSSPPSALSSLPGHSPGLSPFEPIRLLSSHSDTPIPSSSYSPPTDTLMLSGTELSIYSAPRIPHNFLNSRSVASYPSVTIESNHTPPALSDLRDASQSVLQQEKPNEVVLPETIPRFPYSIPDSQPKSHASPASQPDSLPWAENRVDQGSTASLPSPQTFDGILPMAGSPSELSQLRENAFQSSSGEGAKRRPLPIPPSSPHFPRISHPIPSSPPPPYSMFLPEVDLTPTTRDLSRMSLSSVTHSTLVPEAPVIMTPPPNEQGSQGRPPYDSFLCHSPPANTWIVVETSQSEYILLVQLPGFKRDGITIATKRRRILHIVADSWEPEGGHFERRVSFGYDAELAQVRAELDGDMLRVVVPRRISAIIS